MHPWNVCMYEGNHTTVLPSSLNQQNSVIFERLLYVMTILQVIWCGHPLLE